MNDQLWNNWSGSLQFSPAGVFEPESEEEISQIIKDAVNAGKKVRVVGKGHSSTPLVKTRDFLISLKHFKGVEEPDPIHNTATVLSGMTVKEAGNDLFRYGLSLPNTGDVDVQTLAGAIGTGTHGTGVNLQNLSCMLIGARIMDGKGRIREFNVENDEDEIRAFRVALGTCGIFLKMKLKLVPAFYLHRMEWCISLENCLDNFDEFSTKTRNFDFYWYPRNDLVKARFMNEEGDAFSDFSFGKLEMEEKGPGYEILPRSRHLKFDEMEYFLPAEAGIDCFMEVRKQILKKYRKDVAWRVLFRTIKEDNSFISPAYNRPSVSISLHQNAGIPFENYFKNIEPIFIDFGGRPHWGKKHNLKAGDLEKMYPEWEKFHSIRKKMDPAGVFMSDYLKEILIL